MRKPDQSKRGAWHALVPEDTDIPNQRLGTSLGGFSRIVQLLIAVFLCFVTPCARATVASDFDAANRLYDGGNFEGARAAYQKLVDAGSYSASLFYNLGNADYRLGKKGDAFVAYERALTLAPGNPEARANLNLLRDETGARLPSVSWTERAFTWPDDPTLTRTAWLAAVAFWALAFSLLPLAFRRRPAWSVGSLSLLVLGWCTVAFLVAQSRGDIWVVKDMQVSARVAPADGSQLAGSLPMGSHVQLLLERGSWLYVVLPGQNSDARGWISRSAAEPIAIRKL